MTREDLIAQLQKSDAKTVILEERIANGEGGGDIYQASDIEIKIETATCGTKKLILSTKGMKLVGGW
jgi:hypothetical protein